MLKPDTYLIDRNTKAAANQAAACLRVVAIASLSESPAIL
jgi:hypothetical protein